MPINTDLNVDPYFDDFDNEKQYYKVLFKPAFAVQARELTQLQTTLQNQIEEFGGSTYKEGSIIKGCSFTEISDLKYVKLLNPAGFDPLSYVGYSETITISGIDYEQDVTFEVEGDDSGVRARILAAERGFLTRDPNLNTFFIRYLTTSGNDKTFVSGENLKIYKIETVEVNSTTQRTETLVDEIQIPDTVADPIGGSFGLRTSPGVIYQKGFFLYSEEQLTIVSKYNSTPNDVSVGFLVEESIVNAFQDNTLFDNANGSANQNAPGADRLKLRPILTTLPTADADVNTSFFTLTRYKSGKAIQVRDVPQFNAIATELARRTYEESGDYIVQDFKPKIVRRDGNLKVSISPGVGYVKGSRVQTINEFFLDIDDITSYGSRQNQAVSLNYGGYLNLDTTSGTQGDFSIDTLAQVNLKDGGGSTIGTARVRNVTDTKVFLFDVRMTANTLSDVQSIAGSDGEAAIAFGSALQENTNTAMVFDSGTFNIRSTSNRSIPVREARSLTGQSGTSVVLNAALGENFVLDNSDILYLDASNVPIGVTNAAVSGASSDVLTLTLDATTSAAATVYLNKNITAANPFTKISDTLYVKSTFSSSGGSKYNLGFPDVYEIVSIIDINGIDVTNSFKLRPNQKDNYYDHSYIEFIPGSVLPADGLMTITMNAFKLNDTSGNYFFTADSYPSGVDVSKIHPYVSKGKSYTLIDCIDFRPYVEPLSPATYTNAAAEGTAPTVSNSSTGVDLDPAFSSSYSILTPAHNQYASIDYDFYFNRTDSVMLDTRGGVTLVKGTEEKLSAPQLAAGNQMKIADIFIPGPGALTPEEATTQNRPKYSSKLTPKGVQGYTMREIRELDRKIEKLQYYTILNTLELTTKNLTILDANGNNRFKNGIVVDPFTDLNIANTDSVEFNAGFDFTEQSLTPAVRTFPINLKYKSQTNGTIFPDTISAKTASLSRDSDVSVINQRYATEFRNCASNFWNFAGRGRLIPEFDILYDVVSNPGNNGNADPWISDLSSGPLQEVAPLTSTSFETIEGGISQSVSTSSFGATESANIPVGDFVRNFTFEPFIRSREIIVFFTGLRPNTQHYFFFNQVNVDAHVAPGEFATLLGSGSPSPETTVRNGEFGDPVFSDENGTLSAIFAIPEATFYVGTRLLEVADVDAYSSINSAATSGGILEYNAYNFSVETQTITRPAPRPSTPAQGNNITFREPGDGGGDGPSCFVAGTKVTMADGSKKNIEEVLIGEYLLGQDGHANKVKLFDHYPLAGRDLIGINGSGPFKTPEHPLMTKGGWKAFRSQDTIEQKPQIAHLMTNGDLQIGDEILMEDGSWLEIKSLEVHEDEAEQTVYNFVLDGNHTYFADGMLAHNRDPLAQTFFIKDGMGLESNSIFASKVDLYFKRKSSTLGVTIELRETINGYPGGNILPFSRVHLESNDVLTSDDASIATTVNFPSPIRLDTNKEYALVVLPDAANPDYLIFTAKVGGNDLSPGDTQGLPVVQDWGDGVLFTSTNNRAWQSYQDEDVKFNLYRHNFDATSGNVILTNDDNEFISANTNNGRFKTGEIVYKTFESDALTSNTVSIVVGTTEMSGSGLSTTYSAGDYILLTDGASNNQIFKVESSNSTIIITDRPAAFDAVSLAANPIIWGTLSLYDFRYPDFIVLEGSTATSSRKFEAGDDIIGFDSGATINIGSVDNIELSYIQPMITRSNDSVTRTTISGTFADPSNPTNVYNQDMSWNDKTTFGSTGVVVYSKSNDINKEKSLDLTVTMTNNSNVTSSPLIDIESSSVLAYQWKITNDSTTTSKYISKTITLNEDLDAEDFEIYITAYRPLGTDIKIFIKPQAAEDPGNFDSNPWIELEKFQGNSTYTSISNIYDFREYAYRLPAANKNADGVLTYTNDIGTFIGYRSFAIKIELHSESISKAPRVLDYRGVSLT